MVRMKRGLQFQEKKMGTCELKFLLNMNTEVKKQMPINLPQIYKGSKKGG